MDTLQVNSEQGSPASYYNWEVPGKNVVIRLDYGVVDRLLIEVLRGFGAIPRRGAEVGGILLGRAEIGDTTLIRVEDFEPVPCEHRRGPSYLLSEADTARFEEALWRHRYNPEKRVYAVGCYRSHTREGMALSAEDLKHFDSYFPGPSAVFLLVKPFATKVSLAGFFFREEGKVHAEAPYQEFPFRRRELGGGAAPARTPPVRLEAADLEAADRPVEEPFDPTLPAPREDDQIPAFAQPEFQASRFRTGNVWIPLSFLFLLLGVLVGFQAAMTYRPARAAGILSDPYSVSLAASRSGDYLHVRWDRHSQPVRTAQRGVLTIIEGTYDKKVDLDVLQLQNPAVYYRNMSDVVKFRLDLYTKENVAVSETLEWRK